MDFPSTVQMEQAAVQLTGAMQAQMYGFYCSQERMGSMWCVAHPAQEKAAPSASSKQRSRRQPGSTLQIREL